MESLSETAWDVLISGTGLSQSLLALALSRSGKKILHVDKNDYYGGAEAALSLQEAEDWVKKVNEESSGYSTFSNASLFLKAESQDLSASGTQLSFPRAYSLALSPQLIYTQSALIPILVSSKVYHQLEFQAVGSWWICRSMLVESDDTSDSEEVQGPPKKRKKAVLQRVPNGREDLIPDTSIEFKAKVALVKFLNAVAKPDNTLEVEEADSEAPLSDFLERNFRLPAPLHPAIHGISLSSGPVRSTPTKYALPRIRRHLRSVGVFGPGFGSVVPKWGCLAEVAQVACRAGAVGGAVYALGRGIKTISSLAQQAIKEPGDDQPDGGGFEVGLSDGEKIRTKWIAGSAEDVPEQPSKLDTQNRPESIRSITIVASALEELFPTIAEGGPLSAGAVVVVPGDSEDTPPVYLLIHSADTGECPAGQSIIYASTSLPSQVNGHTLLETAITTLLEGHNSSDPSKPATILWSLRYTQRTLSAPVVSSIRAALQDPPSPDGAILTSPPPSLDLAFEDSLLEDVRAMWKAVMGPEAVEDEFMQFEDREAMGGEEEGGSDAE